MSFNQNDPAPTDKLRNWPSSVTTNEWPRLKAMIAADHVFNNSALVDDGYHKIIHFQNQVADPATIAGVTTQFTKTVDVQNELFIKTNLGNVRQITGPSNPVTNGYTYLTNGFIMQWGVYTAPVTGVPQTGSIAFQAGAGAFITKVFTVQITFIGLETSSNSTMQVNTVTPSSFKWQTTNGEINAYTGFYWFAIGV